MKLYQQYLVTHHEFCSRPWDFTAIVWLLLNLVIPLNKYTFPERRNYLDLRDVVTFLEQGFRKLICKFLYLVTFIFCILTPPHPSNLLFAPRRFLSITPETARIPFSLCPSWRMFLEKYSSGTHWSSSWQLQEIGPFSARRSQLMRLWRHPQRQRRLNTLTLIPPPPICKKWTKCRINIRSGAGHALFQL